MFHLNFIIMDCKEAMSQPPKFLILQISFIALRYEMPALYPFEL